MTAPTSADISSSHAISTSLAIEKVSNREELRGHLRDDRVANAYLLGHLETDYFPFCTWFVARDRDGSIESLVTYYEGLSLPAVRAIGSKHGVGRILEECSSHLPNRFHFHVVAPHLDALERRFEVTNLRKMQRMGLTRERYDSSPVDDRVRRLDHRDTASIMKLYEHYPDNLFEPYQLETGYYFGIDAPSEDRLASIAGVHVVSETYDVAAVGNLVTHPEARDEGLATACTGRLLDELFQCVSVVALDVRNDNAPALSVYDRFGFRLDRLFWEGWARIPDDGA
jgi:ribosomal protein S18 acetylase RimI-like enzyme